MTRCKAKVRDRDSFGIPVQLNFNKEATHNTFVGGCCTILAVIIMSLYIIAMLIQLIFTNNFSQQTWYDYLDADQLH